MLASEYSILSMKYQKLVERERVFRTNRIIFWLVTFIYAPIPLPAGWLTRAMTIDNSRYINVEVASGVQELPEV
jgi:hypothetical protein